MGQQKPKLTALTSVMKDYNGIRVPNSFYPKVRNPPEALASSTNATPKQALFSPEITANGYESNSNTTNSPCTYVNATFHIVRK